MKHLDEGLLQAWLDHPRSGLEPSEVAQIERHLDECARCAADLEALRGSSAEAHSLLAAGVDRSVPRPPFEDVVRRARGHEEIRRARRRLSRLAWAASLVVALGVGWWSNDLYRSARLYEAEQAPAAVPARSPEVPTFEEAAGALEPRGDAPAPSARADAAMRSVPQEAPAERREQQAAADARPAPTPAPAEPAPATNELADAASGVGAGSGAPGPSAPVPADAVDAVAPEPAQAAVQVPAPAPAAALARARQAAPAVTDADDVVDVDDAVVVSGVVRDERGDPIASAQVYVEGLRVGALTQQDGRYSLILPARDSMDLTVARIGYRTQRQELSGRAGAPVVADFQLQEEALQLQEVIVTGTVGATQRRALGNTVGRVEAASVPWTRATREEAEDMLGRDLVTLPDASVSSIEVSDAAVRVRQDLGDAVYLTLVQGVGEDGVEAWPVESAGALASRRIGDLLVTATAPLTEDSLRVLLDHVR